MELVHSVSDLHVHSTTWRIYVKMCMWEEDLGSAGSETIMMLGDENGRRIDARIPSGTYLWNFRPLLKEGFWFHLSDFQANKIDAVIPNGLYRHNFKKNLKEGEWYFMSDFNVVPQNPISRYSWHPFMIQCKWETKMVHITPRSINNYMDFIDYDEIKYAGTQEKEYVTVDHLQSPRQMMIRWRKWILTKTKLGG
ncbi:predicted protein [Arabidopsis lyrata subsp. lyrata]|uniref:Predicted protein n=1 Tax=Arabidopsis lyrata subsp. lyrata TaxID=81972 RepID=D7LFF9_ARALL|nr:predicted protein [Arabidopsis lyrata subsp. lyrata]